MTKRFSDVTNNSAAGPALKFFPRSSENFFSPRARPRLSQNNTSRVLVTGERRGSSGGTVTTSRHFYIAAFHQAATRFRGSLLLDIVIIPREE